MPPLTPRQRRRQIIEIIDGHLARMPEGIDVSAGSEASCSGESGAGGGEKDSGQDSQKALELSDELPLTVSDG